MGDLSQKSIFYKAVCDKLTIQRKKMYFMTINNVMIDFLKISHDKSPIR